MTDDKRPGKKDATRAPKTAEEITLETKKIELELAKSKALMTGGCSLIMAGITLPFLLILLFVLGSCLFHGVFG